MTVVVESSAVPLPGLPLHTPIELEDGTTLRTLLHPRGVDADNEPYLLPAVNGEIANLDRVLRDGDRIRLFRLSAGG
jgi:sulfur carrier protein ThiS